MKFYIHKNWGFHIAIKDGIVVKIVDKTFIKDNLIEEWVKYGKYMWNEYIGKSLSSDDMEYLIPLYEE